MKQFVIIFECLVLVQLAAGQIKVKKVIGNCECTGLEIKDNKTQREFLLSCNKTKNKATFWHTSCIYGGDPHRCAKYNKKNQPPKFYQGLVNVMAEDYCAAQMADMECKTDATYYSDTICQEIPYTLNRYP